jgi:hypothetical protein
MPRTAVLNHASSIASRISNRRQPAHAVVERWLLQYHSVVRNDALARGTQVADADPGRGPPSAAARRLFNR